MAKLWTFGDSFTKHENGEYLKWKSTEALQWPKMLSNNLGYELCNFGQQGSSNYDIFQKICLCSQLFEQGDLVIIGWGLLGKFRVIQNNEFFDVHPSDPRSEFAFTQKDRKHIKWVEEVISWEHILGALSDAKNFTLISWSFEEPLLDDRRYFDFETISQETNNIIKDNHLSENGHRQLVDYFLSLL